MSQDEARELRLQGITAAKAGQKEQARQLLQQAIRLEPQSEAAWLWLASVARDQRERVFCLRKILEINPNNEQAQKALRGLEDQAASAVSSSLATPSTPLKHVAPAGQPAAPGERLSTQEMMAMPPGIPTPTLDQVAAAQRKAETITQDFAQPMPTDVRWVKKSKGRLGERDIWVLRAYVGAASLVALVMLCGLSFFIVSTNPVLSGIVFAPTSTLTLTPTSTPTPTPGSTPTPSPTPRASPQPTSTVPPLAPTADIYSPNATAIYPVILEAPLRSAISLLNAGDPGLALPTLSAEIGNTANRYNPNPYYYQAIAQAELGEYEAALATLDEAESRLEEAPNDNFKPLVDAGFAYVYLLQAEAALTNGNQGGASALIIEAQTRAEAATEGDPRLEQGHMFLARVHTLSGDYGDAIDALDAGLAIADLQYNAALIAEKAWVLLQQGSYADADAQAYYALYIDPAAELAHRVRVLAALEQNDPGLAVLHTQAYLFHYPGSVEAYRLLGDARSAERNYDLAMQAYSRALSADADGEVRLQVLLGRASIYNLTRQYALAQADLTEAFDLSRDESIRAQRMEAALRAGDLAGAERDASALSGSDSVPSSVVNYVLGRVAVEAAERGDGDVSEQTIGLLGTGRNGADQATLAEIDEYTARAHYLLQQYESALEFINAALDREPSVMRHYVRGLILEARGQDDDAAREYDWVIAWSSVYPSDQLADTLARRDALR